MPKYLKTIRFIIFFCVLFALTTRASSTAPSHQTVFFYNPEVNINNFASLKIDIDTYLSGFGNYRFQPFSDMETFETFVTSSKKGVMLVSSWHYSMLKSRLPLVPLLVGVSKGVSTYRKVLVVKKSVKDLSQLKNIKLASSGNEEYTQSALEKMVGAKHPDIVKSLKILVVPKDIDALMAVGFGMSQAALTSEKSLKKLSMLNPNLYKSLKTISVSEEFLLPVLAVFNGFSDEERKLVEIVEAMGKSEKGGRDLKMLGLDGWKRLTLAEEEILRR